MRVLKAGALFFLLVFLPSAFAALKIPAKPDGYVTDSASVLSLPARARLESTLRLFEEKTSNQVLIAIFPGLEGESLEDFSIRLAEAWKPGQKARDNGILFLIFRDDRKIRIEVGYGLEGALTDAVSASIIRDVIAPQFRAGNFDQGIEQGAAAILQAVQGEYTASRPAAQASQNDGLVQGLAFLFLIVAVLDFTRYLFYRSGHRAYAERYSFWEWFFLFSILWLLLRAFLTSRGGYSGRNGGWSGGRGGYSGGGGRFGGGGASGGW